MLKGPRLSASFSECLRSKLPVDFLVHISHPGTSREAGCGHSRSSLLNNRMTIKLQTLLKCPKCIDSLHPLNSYKDRGFPASPTLHPASIFVQPTLSLIWTLTHTLPLAQNTPPPPLCQAKAMPPSVPSTDIPSSKQLLRNPPPNLGRCCAGSSPLAPT